MILERLRSPAVATAFVAFAVVALAWAAWRDSVALVVAGGALAAAPGLAATALLAYLGFVAALAASWRGLVHRLGGGPLDLGTTLRVQATAWSARYLPGKVGFTAAKVLLPPGDRAAAAWAAGYEQALFLGAGAAVVAACALGTAALRSALLPGAAPLVVVAVVALAPFIASRSVPLVDRLVATQLGAAAGGGPPRSHPGARELGVRLLGFVGAHACVGLGFVALLQALGHGDQVSVLHAVGALTAAHLGGIVAVFAPAGLGVRELLLAALLAPALGAPEAAAVALVARAWSIVGDLLVAPFAFAGR